MCNDSPGDRKQLTGNSVFQLSLTAHQIGPNSFGNLVEGIKDTNLYEIYLTWITQGM